MINKIRNFKKTLWLNFINATQVCVVILGLILVLWIASKIGVSIGTYNWPPSTEKMVNWSQIIIAYAAIYAIGQYAVTRSEISDRKTKTVLEQVKFFRETVICSADRIRSYKRKHKIVIPIIQLRKNTPFLQFTEKNYFNKIFPNQKLLVEEYKNLISNDMELEEMIRSCINSAEEFSIGILNTNSQKHEAVSSIKKPFVEIIEQLAVPLYLHIGITEDKFSYLSQLYDYWKKEVGFLPYTTEDRIQRYNEREKKFKK